jgi:hypothetical protein
MCRHFLFSILVALLLSLGLAEVALDETTSCTANTARIDKLESRIEFLKRELKNLQTFVHSMPEAKAQKQRETSGPVDMNEGNMINNVFYRGNVAKDDRGNDVEGIGNVVNGMNNIIRGNKNQVTGSDNSIQRSGSMTMGSGNKMAFRTID